MAEAHRVRLSSADRVVFPDPGLTKGDVFAYYEAVGPTIVPHLQDRPFTMRRFRDGIDGEGFYQKDAPKGMPGWIPTFDYLAHPRRGRPETRLVHFPLVQEVPALLWMVQMHCIEAHVWLSRRDRPDRPDLLVLDLDPPDGRPDLAVRTAHAARELLQEVGLEGFPRTSGGDGIHVVVPVARRATFADTEAAAVAIRAILVARHPGLVTDTWRVADRGDAVLLDVAQNGMGRTMVAPYSLRPRPGAPVATPLEWSELDEGLQPRTLDHSAVLRRIGERGDLAAPLLEPGQGLAKPLEALRRLERAASA